MQQQNKLTPEQILEVAELDDKIAKEQPEKDINPEINQKFFNYERIWASGDEGRTLGAIVGNGIYGIIKGLLTSWFMRIAILIIGIVVYLLFREVINTYK
jgi:hypothetical protein